MTRTSNDLASQVREHGGFSYSVANGTSPQAGERKFAVAISKEAEQTFELSTFSPMHLISYIAAHASLLHKAGVHLGAWVDNGLVYLDCSVVVSDYDLAVKLAQDNEQLAIFCFETMTSRPVLRVVH